MSDLPPFPIDDVTLAAIEHSLDAHLTYRGDDGSQLDEPRVIGADYQLTALLDFLSGAAGPDPNGYRLTEEGRIAGVDADVEVWVDERDHYTERDVLRALIAEIRRLRDGGRE